MLSAGLLGGGGGGAAPGGVGVPPVPPAGAPNCRKSGGLSVTVGVPTGVCCPPCSVWTIVRVTVAGLAVSLDTAPTKVPGLSLPLLTTRKLRSFTAPSASCAPICPLRPSPGSVTLRTSGGFVTVQPASTRAIPATAVATRTRTARRLEVTTPSSCWEWLPAPSTGAAQPTRWCPRPPPEAGGARPRRSVKGSLGRLQAPDLRKRDHRAMTPRPSRATIVEGKGIRPHGFHGRRNGCVPPSWGRTH